MFARLFTAASYTRTNSTMKLIRQFSTNEKVNAKLAEVKKQSPALYKEYCETLSRIEEVKKLPPAENKELLNFIEKVLEQEQRNRPAY